MNWNIKDGKITVSFPYDPTLIAKVREVPGRRWKADQKAWEFPDCLPVRSYLKHFFQVSFSDPEYVGYTEPVMTSVVRPYEHQKKMTAAIVWSWEKSRHLGMFAETGTGKTKAAIDAICEIDRIDPTGNYIIVCPAPLLGVWMDEFDKHGLSGVVNKYHGPKRMIDTGKQVLLTSYETLKNDIELIERYCNFFVAFLDESQKTKDTSTLNHKACRKIRAITKVLMTGTPYGNSYMDIHGQFHVTDDVIFGNKKTFQSTFCIFGGWENKEIVGWRNLSMLEEIMRRYSIVVRKSECLNLPQKTYQTIKLEMNDEQKRVYRRAEAGAVGDVPITTVLTEIAKLRQISSGFAYIGTPAEGYDGVDGAVGELHREVARFGTQKTAYLNSISYHEPTIIWFNFREERDQIIKVLEDNHVPYAVADGENMAAKGVADFESGVVKVLVAQLQSVQYGFTCNQASRVIYYSPTFSLLQRAQSEDRCHRIGQTKNVHYISLVSSKIEEWMMEAVANKCEVRDHVMTKLKSIFEE